MADHCFSCFLEDLFGFGDYDSLFAIGWFRLVKTDIQQTSHIPMLTYYFVNPSIKKLSKQVK